MNISIVIPAYNESKNIKVTINEILPIVEKVDGIEQTEIIVVDDHSSDNTFSTVKEMNDPRVKALRLSKHCGSHTALRAGIKEAGGEVVLCISADGQDDPNCLEKMLEKWRQGARVVWALRKSRDNEPWYIRRPAQAFYKILLWLGSVRNTNIDISRANFCLLDEMVVRAINLCSESNASLFGLILWLGFNHDAVEYKRRTRRFGSSKWTLGKNFALAKDWIVGFSGLPLTLIFFTGIIFAAIGLIYLIIIAIHAIMGNALQGWSSIIAVILFIGGLQMIMIGIVSEYIWTSLNEARKRPLFLIENRWAKEKSDNN